MITTEIASAAIQIAEEFDRMGIVVVAKAGTPLERLVSLSTMALGDGRAIEVAQSGAAEYTPNPDLISTESSMAGTQFDHGNGEFTQIDGHAEALEDNIVDHVAAVSSHFDFTRNHVKPLVKELAEKIQTYLASYPETASYNPVVIRYDLPEPILNAGMASSLAGYAKVAFQPLTHADAINGAPLSAQEVLELIKTGSKVIDSDIEVWAARLGDGFFASVYNSVFGAGRGEGEVDIPTFDALVTDRGTGPDAAAVLFLAGKKMLDAPPSEGLGMDLANYRVKVGLIINQAGRHLNAALEQRDREYKQKLMIRSYNRDQVVVFAPVYDDWLAAGNNVAALFGNLLADRPAIFANAIAEASSANIQLWERQNRILTATLSTNRNTGVRSAIKLAADELLRANLKECFGGYTGNDEVAISQPEVVTAIKGIRDYVDCLKNDELDDVWKIATTVVASKIFYYTDSYAILLAIDQAFKDNPEISMDEAVLISRICYVADYCTNQLDTRPLS